MSGHKRVTISISEKEYRKLHEAEMRKRFLNEPTTHIQNELKQEIKAHRYSEMDAIEKRQQALEDLLNQVNREICHIEGNTSQAYLQHQRQISQEIEDVLDNTSYDTEAALASFACQVQLSLQDVIENHNRDRAWLESEWQRQAQGRHQKSILAREWLQAATALEQFIVENYDHQRIFPGRVERIGSRLVQSQNNLGQHFFEAALASAQDAYNQYSDLRLALEKQNAEAQLLIQRVNLKAQEIERLITDNKVVPAIDLEGNPLSYQIDVDHWNDGSLTQLENELTGVMTDVFDSPQNTTEKLLNELLSDYFPLVEEKVSEFVFNARIKVLNAQMRVNVAEIVIRALSTQGYELDNSSFTNGDERTALQAKLTNYDGSQVLVQIDPVSDQIMSNELHVSAYDAPQKTSHELHRRALEIQRALQSSGLEVGIITAKAPLLADNMNQIERNSIYQKSIHKPSDDRIRQRLNKK